MTASTNQLYHLGIKAIIQNDKNEILLLKSVKGYWDFPGGRIQTDEEALSALLREVREETGINSLIDIQPDVMIYTSIKIPTADNNSVGLLLWYYTCRLQNQSTIKVSNEHTDYLWVPANQVRKMTLLDEKVALKIFGDI